MAFQGTSRRVLSSLPSLSSRARYYPMLHLHSPISSSLFSTLNAQSQHEYVKFNPNQSSSHDEPFVLHQLSVLLPIPHQILPPKQFDPTDSNKKVESVRAVDGFLMPDEKLRGVFLQKLKGIAVIEHALDNVGVDLSVDVVAQVVNRGCLGGEAMLVFFNWAIKKPNVAKHVHTYHIILKALGRRKFFNYMMEVLNGMRSQDIRLDLETVSIVMDSFVRAGHVSKVIQVFRNSAEFGLDCDTECLNVLLQCLWEVRFNGTTYNIVIGGWSKYGRVGEMERTLEAMVADGFSPDSATFSYILEGLGRADRIDDAVEIFESMKGKGCVPDNITYNAMISNFISVANIDECVNYFKSMSSNACDPNVDTYTKLIAGFLKARKVADALEMFDEMLSRGFVPTTGTITSFMEPLCSYGQPYAAMMIYQKARKVGCRISLTAYKLLLMRLSRFGKCGMLLNIWEEMQECGYASDIEVYEYVISGLCNIGQLENAVLVMEESLQKGFCPSRLTYSKLSNKLLASNKLERAYKLYLKIKAGCRFDKTQRIWRARGWHF
ncbi:putative pentatricopeptide [Rosa chinensis]|uniref:Putative pentatricopeptide n=1 Tax=Rosa chinensis TaxID=74649 RepID=A0A2P6PR37_ROSCH|nr:putative pentatricopeptide [Rosa chinensis]